MNRKTWLKIILCFNRKEVVIGAEFGKEDYNSILRNYNRKGAGTT
jgi:hypothetical protein